ncbi:Homeodomain-like protein [Phlyctochytrium arcticum]|nr:Homeodomain-like protein [Phlyctochytrium arcticum]
MTTSTPKSTDISTDNPQKKSVSPTSSLPTPRPSIVEPLVSRSDFNDAAAMANEAASNLSTRRKKVRPNRSLPSSLTDQEKLDMGVIKLDVYSVYKSKPATLLENDGSELRRSKRLREEAPSESEEEETARKVSKRGGKNRRGRQPRGTSRSASAATEHISESGSTKGAPIVTWTKGDPLPLTPDMPHYADLTPEELVVCSTLRLLPESYLKIKNILLGAKAEKGTFKKRDAQKWCRVDVNKTGKLYDWFLALGWLDPHHS